MELFGIRDQKADTFVQYHPVQTTAMAIRSFEAAAQTEDHEFNRYPDDFSLWRLGTIADSSGVLTPEVNGPTLIGHAREFQPKE